MMQKMFATSALIIGLTACEGEASPGEMQADASLEVPDFAQEWIDSDLATDGEIHVRSTGEIIISPDTPVCFWPGGLWIDADELFASLGQVKSDSSGSRLKLIQGGDCGSSDDSVLIKAVRTQAAGGLPYKLVLVVWQNDAAWVAAIQRTSETPRPGFERPLPAGEEGPLMTFHETQEVAASADALELGREFVEQVIVSEV